MTPISAEAANDTNKPVEKKLKKYLSTIFILTGLFFIVITVVLVTEQNNPEPTWYSPVSSKIIHNRPLEKYSFDNLSRSRFLPSQINIGPSEEIESKYTTAIFTFSVEAKKVSGQINIPTTNPPANGFPVIVMLRGWVDAATYKTGDGTKNAAAFFAQNGFVTLAPDFLGYGTSDPEDPDTFSARVQRPLVVLTLLKSIPALSKVDPQKIFLWGHSNGGQIAVSILEIIGQSPEFSSQKIPTTLWAPVSKPFPYSVLYYTDESDDYGKALRMKLAEFEKTYNVNDFSIHSYYDRISSPIQLHQGTADDAVPVKWSDELNNTLLKLHKDIIYYQYPGADHNLQPSWNTVVNRDLNFFKNYLENK